LGARAHRLAGLRIGRKPLGARREADREVIAVAGAYAERPVGAVAARVLPIVAAVVRPRLDAIPIAPRVSARDVAAARAHHAGELAQAIGVVAVAEPSAAAAAAQA